MKSVIVWFYNRCPYFRGGDWAVRLFESLEPKPDHNRAFYEQGVERTKSLRFQVAGYYDISGRWEVTS